MADDGLVEILHVGTFGCGDVAVCHLGRPVAGAPIELARLLDLDGAPIPLGRAARCLTCGRQIERAATELRPAGGWAER